MPSSKEANYNFNQSNDLENDPHKKPVTSETVHENHPDDNVLITALELEQYSGVNRRNLYKYNQANLLFPAISNNKRRSLRYQIPDIELAQKIRRLELANYSLEDIQTSINQNTLDNDIEYINNLNLLSLNELSALAGINATTIRRHHQAGLIDRIEFKNKTMYPPETVAQLELIKRLLHLKHPRENLKLILAEPVIYDMLINNQNIYNAQEVMRLTGIKHTVLYRYNNQQLIQPLELQKGDQKIILYDDKIVENIKMITALHQAKLPYSTIKLFIEDDILTQQFLKFQNTKILTLNQLCLSCSISKKNILIYLQQGFIKPIDDHYLKNYYLAEDISLLKDLHKLVNQGISFEDIKQQLADNISLTQQLNNLKHDHQFVNIKELADSTNASLHKLNYYKSIGLITPSITVNKTLLYETESSITRLTQIEALTKRGVQLQIISQLYQNNQAEIIDKILTEQILTIKQVSDKIDVSPSILRRLTHLNLITVTDQFRSGAFIYDAEVVEQITKIKTMLNLGWSYQEIQYLIDNPPLKLIKKSQVLSLDQLAQKTDTNSYSIRKWTDQKLLTTYFNYQDKLWYSIEAIARINYIKNCLEQGINDPTWTRNQLNKLYS